MSVSIKKSIKLNSAGKKKWWLTILAPPECLSVIDEKWDSLSCPSHWRLLSRLSDLGPPSGNPPLLGGDVPNEPDGPPSQNSISNPLVPSENNPLSTHATPQDNLFFRGQRAVHSPQLRAGGGGLNPSHNMHTTPCNQVTSILNVCCLNIRGFKSNSDYLRTLLMSHDLLAISEHWLHDYDLHLLSSFSDNFLCFSSTSPSREDPVWCRPNFLRGQGGVAILFKKSLQNLVKKLDTSLSHRVVGLQLRTLPLPICFLGVYLPSRSGCTDTFRECLDYIDSD